MSEEVSTEDEALVADAMDAAAKKYLAMCEDRSLEEHDRRFHPNGYKEGDACKVRDRMKTGDKSDGEVSAKTAEQTEKSEEKDVLGEVAKLAREFSDLKEEGRMAPLLRKNPRYRGIEPRGAGVRQCVGDWNLHCDTMAAQKKFFSALKDVPWSAFGKNEDAVFDKLSDFAASLPYDSNLDALLQVECDGVDDNGADEWNPEEVFEMFCDARDDDDVTLGDTMKNAKSQIESVLNDRAAESAGYESAAEEDWQNYQTERDAFRNNAPFTAWASGY